MSVEPADRHAPRNSRQVSIKSPEGQALPEEKHLPREDDGHGDPVLVSEFDGRMNRNPCVPSGRTGSADSAV
jgi:hypothetical protein